LVHLANTALVFALAFVLVGRAHRDRSPDPVILSWAAAGCAAIFAVHPLRAESVAWITERGSLVSTFFLLACVLNYIRYSDDPLRPRRWYLLALAFFAVSLLSKAWAITLPIVLLLIDFYPLRRWPVQRLSQLILEKLPFVVIAIAVAGLAYYAKSRAGMISLHQHGWPQRFAQAAYGLCFYPWKTLWPSGLSPIHELPIPFDPLARRFVISGVVVVAIGVVLVLAFRRWAAPLTATLAYAILVSPALGLAQTGPQLVADRYSYVSCIPFAVLIGGALLIMSRRVGACWPAIATTAAVVALSVAAWNQCGVWQTSTTLWARALQVDPRSPTANSNMGAQFVKAGRFSDAIECFRTALSIQPDAIGMVNLASALTHAGDTREARRLLREALEADPRNVRTLLAAARIRERLSDDADACDLYRRAVAVDPDRAAIHYAHGHGLLKMGRSIEAAASYETTIRLLEPAIRRGAGGETVRLYRDCCGRLEAFHAARDDHARAQTYRQRTDELSPRE
jgi:Tfp pilus assembly protein PilF